VRVLPRPKPINADKPHLRKADTRASADRVNDQFNDQFNDRFNQWFMKFKNGTRAQLYLPLARKRDL
jgi:hypothetical protein